MNKKYWAAILIGTFALSRILGYDGPQSLLATVGVGLGFYYAGKREKKPKDEAGNARS